MLLGRSPFLSSYVTAAGRVSRGAILGRPIGEAIDILGSIITPAAEMGWAALLDDAILSVFQQEGIRRAGTPSNARFA